MPIDPGAAIDLRQDPLVKSTIVRGCIAPHAPID
jgi:hypothetical protein